MTDRTIAGSLPRVDVGRRALVDYRTLLVPGMHDEIVDLAAPLRGVRVLHLSATPFGGGVAEILRSLVPLLRDVGVEAEWAVMDAPEEFFAVTKQLHNALQGDEHSLDDGQWATWEAVQHATADRLELEDIDLVFVHDPQPAGVAAIAAAAAPDVAWAWRCHIDLSAPHPGTIERLLPWLEPYGAAFFHRPEYVPSRWSGEERAWVVAPAIDPLAEKNLPLHPIDAAWIVRQFGIDPDRPLMTQVSRFDPWKDPLGVIDAWRRARGQHPRLQLALLGSLALDDPEGREFLARTLAHLDGEPGAVVLTNLDGIGDVEVNAFQVVSDVVLQKSTREGFGLTVAEALWKARPVVAGDVGGIRSQLVDGETGWLVADARGAADAVCRVLEDPAAAAAMARSGKAHVRREFLTPRYLLDHLRCYRHLLEP